MDEELYDLLKQKRKEEAVKYVKNKYNQVSTHLNEYNYINKVLYNHYNNIDDEKYNKIKEGLK